MMDVRMEAHVVMYHVGERELGVDTFRPLTPLGPVQGLM
jgi:hypothetical protein